MTSLQQFIWSLNAAGQQAGSADGDVLAVLQAMLSPFWQVTREVHGDSSPAIMAVLVEGMNTAPTLVLYEKGTAVHVGVLRDACWKSDTAFPSMEQAVTGFMAAAACYTPQMDSMTVPPNGDGFSERCRGSSAGSDEGSQKPWADGNWGAAGP